MKCEKCGNEAEKLLVDFFDHNGNDNFYKIPIQEVDENAVVMNVPLTWTGYELTEEEMPDTIICPHCKQFPFKDKEIQTYEFVRIVCFKSPETAEEINNEH